MIIRSPFVIARSATTKQSSFADRLLDCRALQARNDGAVETL